MFDIGASELLMIVIVAVVVIGPKDMPMALRTAGRWIGKMRRVSNHFRAGVDAMVREAELEEMERKWREQNEAIMKSTPQLPSAEEMGPIASRPSQARDAPASPPTTETETPREANDQESRQAELNLPPPPP